MYTRIVVPLDGSDIAEQALTPAEDLARTASATMHLVRVVDYPPSSYTYVYGAMIESEALTVQLDDAVRLAATYLEEVAKPLIEQGLTVTTEVRHGVACQELTATMTPGDCFVIASHGRSGVARWFLGSVAEEITRHATVPVLLIRAGSPASSRRIQQAARRGSSTAAPLIA